MDQPFRLILASASPRRRELLAQAGYTFTVKAADVDESERAGEPPDAYVRRLAEEKAQAVFDRRVLDGPPAVETGIPSEQPLFAESAALSLIGINENLLVLGADTTVVLDGQILAKPEDEEDAKQMLRRLSGRTHQVLTGIAVATRASVRSDVETTEVTFREITNAELDAYCATHEPLDKAGAYGIQGYAARWIPRIQGDYFNVMGLPIARVVRMIEESWAIIRRPA